MGCDIHLHTEVKINGEWHHYSVLRVRRDYKLFAQMAGVRNYYEVTPISEPKGLPQDASFLTKFDADRWDVDGHSHSYLDAQEIKLLKAWLVQENPDEHFILPDIFGFCFGNDWTHNLKYPDEKIEGVEDVRFVFWFDN